MDQIVKAEKLKGKQDIIQGFSTRSFGDMKFDGSNREKVIKNRQNFLKELGIGGRGTLVRASQVHGTHIYQVKGSDLRKDNRIWQEAKIKNCDGLITDLTNTWLAITVGDCVPVFLWSEDGKYVGVVHAGWQGTLNEITDKAVKKMSKVFPLKPGGLYAYIGPSIGPEHFEVKDDLWSSFKKKFDNQKVFIEKEGRKYIDLWQINKDQLKEKGVKESRIEVAEICTVCQNRRFFSHRKNDKERMLGLIGLKSS